MLKFLITVCVLSSVALYAADEYDELSGHPTWYVYDLETDQAITSTQLNLRNAEKPFTREDFKDIFDNLTYMKSKKSAMRGSSSDSEASEKSVSSDHSVTSTGEPVTSKGYVEELEENVIPNFLNSQKTTTAKQRANRQTFVDVLRSYQDEVDPQVFQTAIELIIEPIISSAN